MDGLGIVQEATKIRSFALKRAGKDKEAKEVLRKVLELQKDKDEAEKKQKEIEQEMQAKAEDTENKGQQGAQQ